MIDRDGGAVDICQVCGRGRAVATVVDRGEVLDACQDCARPIAAIDALARDIAERRSGVAAYLVDDETWFAALAEAEATYAPSPPKSSVQEAVDRARNLDPVKFINAYNEARSQDDRW